MKEAIAPLAALDPASSEWGHELAISLAALGRRGEAREVLAPLHVRAREFGAPGPIGWLLCAQGVVDGDASAVRTAIAALEQSEDGLARIKAVTALGAILRRAGEGREARDHLRKGLELARSAGAGLVAGQAADELRAAGGRKIDRATRGVDSLTPSELRISALAAEGSTNKQIAHQLFLTVGTVEMHLGNAYRKLDVKTRRELPEALAP